MWKFLIFVVYFSPSIASAFRLGNIECEVAPTPQSFGRISCNGDKCTVTCIQDYKFPNGEEVLEITCYNNEKWIVASYGNLPECSPTCSPACLNSGKCVETDRCLCQGDYTGHRCQTKIQVCVNKIDDFFSTI